MRFSKCFLVSIFWAFATGFALAEVGDNVGEPTGSKISEKAGEVGAGGDFTYGVSFDLPEFRGLVPDLALDYRSSRISRNSVESYLGQGWHLDGLSVIRRKSLGGGVPTYEDGADVYEVDGRELLACAGSTATNPWSRNYPLRYIADKSSASCRHGGNLTARVEDYTRYHFNATSNTFTVTRRDGVRFVYQSLGDLAGDASVAGSYLQLYADNTYWLLTEISDTQRDGAASTAPVNAVAVTYQFAEAAKGYAFRPSKVEYAGYKVEFGYQELINPLSMFPTTSQAQGAQHHLLRSVQVYDGTTKVRAYDLDYVQSPLLQAQLLSTVTQYGNNFAVTAGVITSGTALPPTTFEYSSDAFSFQETTYPGVEFHEIGLVYDRDSDGRDELALFPWEKRKRVPQGPDPAIYPVVQSYTGKRLGWDANKEISRNLATTATCSTTGEFPNSQGQNGNPIDDYGRDSGRYVYNARIGNRTLCYAHRLDKIRDDKDGSSWYTTPELRNFDSTSGTIVANIPNPTSLADSPIAYKVANLDLDPELELVTSSSRILDVTPEGFVGGGIVGRKFFASVGRDSFLSDFTGDGVTDLVWREVFLAVLPEITQTANTVLPRASTLTTILPRAENPVDGPPPSGWTYEQMQERAVQGVGDFNGDGINDIIYHVSNGGAADQLLVYYGTGRGFRPPRLVSLSNFLTLPRANNEFPPPRVVNHRSEVADLNGDGLDDLIVHEGFSYETNYGSPINVPRFVSKNSWILLNKGNEEFVQVPVNGSLAGFDGLVFVGDFDGNGLTDIVREGADGKILYGTGEAPNRLKKVTTSLGGTYDVAYTPSSAFGETRIPFVQQLVTGITTDDGRGNTATTTFAYAGGAYDFIAREPLGYATVTTTLPAIAGETEGPHIVRTYFVDSLATSGILEKEERFSSSGTLLASSVNEVESDVAGKGPHFARVIATTEGHHSGGWVETKSIRSFNENGLVSSETSLGFAVAGQDIAPEDNRRIATTYSVNEAAFILDRVKVKKHLSGPSSSEQWLAEQYFYYDDPAAPIGSVTEGNLVVIKDVNRLSSGMRTWVTRTYDAFGNVITEKDARGFTTSFSYDAVKQLFTLSTTTAAGETNSATWDTGCQAPLTEEDANSQITTYQYDALCRETTASLPGGQIVITTHPVASNTSINTAGDPTEQYVRKDVLSASTLTGRTKKLTWEYFDGLGRGYRTAATGSTTAGSSAVNTLRGYDARGNLAWQSIPLMGNPNTPGETQSGVGGGDPDAPDAVYANPTAIGMRTVFTYDGLDRLLTRTEADGAKTENAYAVTAYASSGAAAPHPGVRVRDAHCFDASTAGTACGQVTRYQDAFGNTVLEAKEANTTDVATATGDGMTHYQFDGLDRLIGVTDPIGATWSYVYDGWGDRVQTNDPGLGTWNLTYDAMHNLKTQVDAKQQTIAFQYDAVNRVTSKTVTGTGYWSATYFTYGQPGSNPAGYFNVGRETRQYVKTGTAQPGVTVHDARRDYTDHGKVARETHLIDGRSYEIASTYALDGSVLTQTLPLGAYPAAGTTIGPFTYDAASRVMALPGLITSISYDPRLGGPLREQYANGVIVDYTYDPLRGWLTSAQGRKGSTNNIFNATYTRTATSRIKRYSTNLSAASDDDKGTYNFTYDASGRLRTASNDLGFTGVNQVMTYDAAGRLRSKGRTTATSNSYSYATGKHAPDQVGTDALTYDANGNMTTAPGGRVIDYDAENRPISVIKAGVKTCYVYGVGGARLKKIANLPAAQNCLAALPANTAQTVYFGPMEIENFKLVGSEKVVAFPHPNVRLTDGATAANAAYLHRDHLNSVRAITPGVYPSGTTEFRTEATVYKPYGERVATINLTVAPEDREDKGWIGERFDPETNLQYLNARYYDPELGMFLQPDWWEVTKPGVGTNRYAYSFGDPTNKLDPGGNAIAGKSLDGDKKTRDAAMKASEKARAEAIASAKAAKDLADKLQKGKKVGIFSPLNSFRNRLEKTYGPVSVSSLERYADLATQVADAIGPPGRGLTIEHYGVWEKNVRTRDPNISNKELDAMFTKQFGISKFKNADGIVTGFTGRMSAGGWGRMGDTIALDKGWRGGSGTIGHEAGHSIGLKDHHSLAGHGYGSVGVAAALEAGVAWQNADSYACASGGKTC